LAADGGMALPLEGIDLTLVIVVMAVALLALAVAGMLVREVLAAQQGTERMRNIAVAGQEGAGGYRKRQFRTLVIFVVVIPLLLLLLPADDLWISIGRSVFFAVGALLSAATGFIGRWLAVRGNIRVAAAARGGDDASNRTAMRIAFRTGGVAGMITVGLGLLGAAIVVLFYKGDAPIVLEGFGFGAAPPPTRMNMARRAAPSSKVSGSVRLFWPCSCVWAEASSPRRPTSVPTSSARSNKASPRTTHATPRPSRTTSVTTWVTAQAWPLTCSSPTPSFSWPRSSSAGSPSVSKASSSPCSYRCSVSSPQSCACASSPSGDRSPRRCPPSIGGSRPPQESARYWS